MINKKYLSIIPVIGLFIFNSLFASAVTFVEGPPSPNVDNVTPDLYANLSIVDYEIDRAIFDPLDSQEVEIEFTLNKEAYVTVEIFQSNEVIAKLETNRYYQYGGHSLTWDGRDIFGDFAEEDEYIYRITAESGAEKDKVTGTIIVKHGYEGYYEDETTAPRLKRVYTAKELFDPAHKEKNYLVFTLTAEANVRAEIYDNRDVEIYKFIDEKNLPAGTYSYKLDNDELDQYKREIHYRIHAENSEGEDSEVGIVKLDEEDTKLDKKPNVYQDTTDGRPYNQKGDSLGISFKLDRHADLTIEIYDDEFLIKTITEETPLEAGSHTIYWDGRDTFGDLVSDGVYQYKISAGNFKGRDVERGNFSIEEYAKVNSSSDNCAGFNDVHSSDTYCKSIKWAKDNQIISGFPDGTFKANNPVTRVEALKMILTTLHARMDENSGQELGFGDTDRFAWYSDYIRTALSLGVINGYADGTFRPSNMVLRSEALIMLLNTARSTDSLIIPTSSYGQPYFDVPNTRETQWYISYAWYAQTHKLTNSEYYLYPSNYMTRAELADMLYRYKHAM